MKSIQAQSYAEKGLPAVMAGVTLILVVLSAFMVWGAMSGNFADDLETMMSKPWGVVAVADVYAGLLLVALWIGYRERRPLVIGAWVVALSIIGNVASCIYVLIAYKQSQGDARLFWTGR